MKHLKLFFALFAMLALGVGNAWAEEATLTFTKACGGTGTDSKGNTWTVTSDAAESSYDATKGIHYGTGSKAVSYLQLSTSSISGTITKVEVNASGASGTTAKLNVTVGGSSFGAQKSLTSSAATYAFEGNAEGAIVVKLSQSSAKKALYVKSVKVTYETSGSTEPVLSSIAISGELTKDTYEEGEELDLAGLTVTAKYDDNSEEDVTNDVEWSYTPNPLIKGTTSVDVTATYEDKTATKTINGLTVKEHVVTSGTYGLLLNNVFFGTTAGTNVPSFPTSAKQDDITVTLNGSGTKTRTDAANVRMYSGNTLTFSVPAGYVIKSIIFAEPTSDKKWEGSITVDAGSYDDATKSWSGSAQSVVFSMGAQNRIAKATVTYIKDVKYALTITEPTEGGTLVVKDGENVLTSGAEIYEGTKLTVTATPETGYEEGVVVVKNAGDENITATVYADGVLTMPAYAVTVSATFAKKPCELLAKPTVSATTTYNSATLTWAAVANAAKYSVMVGETTTEVTEPTFTATGLNAETTYTYQVQAIAEADQDTYCDSEVAEGTFTTATAPTATLTLKDIVGTTTQTGALNSTIILPTEAAECSKTFVGWSAVEILEPGEKPATNFYARGAEYTFTTLEPTLYAVYADENNATNEEVHTFASFTQANTVTIDAPESFTITLLKGTASTAPQWNSGSSQARVYAKGSLVISADAPISKIVYTYVVNKNNNGVEPTIDGVSGNNNAGNWDASAKTWTGNDTEVTFSTSGTAGNVGFTKVAVTVGAITYSNYSTTCAAAPIATVNPTSVTTTAAGAEGKVTVTYENVNTANVAVALFNDAACTETFTAGWLTASIDADKNITYTVAENTTYAERKAYIKLTAPETTGAIDPAVVVIPVTQAGKDKVFASLEELLANITPTEAATKVTVTLTKEPIVEIYVSGTHRNGIYLNVPYQGENKKIEIYCWNVPATWVLGGSVSGTLTNCDWKDYNGTWELCPADWSELTYTAPATVSSIAVSGTPTTTTYVDGEKFDPAGLVVTATYSDATTENVTTYANWTIDPATLTKGQTSVNVTATYNSISSAAYEVTGLTVNDIPTKTVAEFIAAGGTRCYLEGIVSNITNTTYGNFDLTDASGKIFVYGCLNAAGEKQKFAALGVKNGDKIKVIADEYELYGGTKDEAKNVQYVSHISAASITIANIIMEVGETKTIAATVVPAEAEVTYTIKENAANAISLSGNTITALAEGTATITATVAEGATYLSNTVDFTVTVNPQNIATLPFEFDGKQADIENTPGMSHDGIDATDYKESPYLKMNTTGDWLIIHFDERPGKLTYDIEANTGSDGDFSGTFTVQESADGVTYRNLAVYTTINTTKESKAHNCFDKDTRYIKFIFTTKNNGNVALGNIKIEKSVVTKVTPTIVENSYFSVGDNKYVQFSTGNLQYEVGTNTWSFASKQYEVIGGEAYTGTNNTNYGMNEPGYTGKLDLFGWSSDDKFGVNPSNTDADYGTDGVNEFVDWGHLVNETGWYTLTKEEMNHILARTKDGKKLWALATVCEMNGLILLPDNWNTSITLDYGYVPANFNYTKNQIDDATWQTLEAAGAVFLPEGGTRVGGHGNKEQGGGPDEFDAHSDYFHVDNVGSMGYYWLNTQDARDDYQNCASFLILPGWSEGPTDADNDDVAHSPQVWSREKRRGNSVRLVKEVKPDYTREDQGAGVYGTVCYKEDIVWCDGATLYEVAGKEGNKVIFDEVTTPEAGMPYIFIAEQEKVNFFCGSANATEAGKHNSLQSTFTEIKDTEAGAAGNILEGNYMLVNNVIKKCGAKCGLKANRAYFVAYDLENMDKAPAAAPGRRRISLDVTSENTTTGVDNITNGENTTIKVIENGQLIIIRNGEKFNAQGIKL